MATWPSPPAPISAGDVFPSVGYDKLIQMGIHLKERLDGLTPFTNSDAGALAAGNLLIQDAASGERKFKKSAGSAGAAGPFFVALDAVAIAGTGYAAHIGFTDLLYTGTAPVTGDQLQASGTAGLAMVGTTNPFAVAYAGGSGGSVQAILYGPGGAGSAPSVFTTSTDGLVPGPSGSEDDSSHVLAGDGTWLDTSTIGGGGGLLDFMPAFTPPVLTSLTKINENVTVPFVQDGSTVRVKAGPLEAFPNVRILAHLAANTHWHFRAAVLLSSLPQGCLCLCSIDDTTGKFAAVRLTAITGTWASLFNNFNSPTSHNAGISGAIGAAPLGVYWCHVKWDGTSIKISYSGDAGNPTDMYVTDPSTLGWAGGHVPTQYGIGIEGQNTLYNQEVRILSWEEIALP